MQQVTAEYFGDLGAERDRVIMDRLRTTGFNHVGVGCFYNPINQFNRIELFYLADSEVPTQQGLEEMFRDLKPISFSVKEVKGVLQA